MQEKKQSLELPDPSESSFLRVAYSCHDGLKVLAKELHSRTLIPFGILAGHCVEAMLKCHLMQNGWTATDVRHKLGHDLEAAWVAAAKCGPPIEGAPPQWVMSLNWGHDRPYPYRYLPHQYGVGTPHAEQVIEPIAPILEVLRQRCGQII